VSNSARQALIAPVVKSALAAPSIVANSAVDIACPSAGMCVTGGTASSAGVVEWFKGSKRTRTTVIHGATYLQGIACAISTSCVAVGYKSLGAAEDAVVATFGPSTSSVKASVVAHVADLQAVTCLSAKSCIAVGNTTNSLSGLGAVVPTISGKAGKDRTAAGTEELAHITCGTSATCWATGDAYSQATGVTNKILKLTDDSPGKPIPELLFGADLACVRGTTGYLATSTAQHGMGKVDKAVNGIVTASVTLPAFADGALDGIACPMSTSCPATGPTGFHKPRSELLLLHRRSRDASRLALKSPPMGA